MAYRNRKKNYPLYKTTHFKDFKEMIENVAERYPDRSAIRYKANPSSSEQQFYTYLQGRDIVRALATEWIAMGTGREKVAIIGEASPEWVFSYFSLMAMGAITVPVDKDLPVADIASILNTAECRFVVFSASCEKKVCELKELVPSLESFVQMNGEIAPYAIGYAEVERRGKEKLAAGDRSYLDLQIDPDELATIVFTSGTTGKGKGVMLSVTNICSDMEQGMYLFDITPKTMCVLPPHHTFGSTVNFVGHYAQGSEIYISAGLRYIMNELKEFRPSHLILVPLFVETFYKRILSTAEKQGKLKLLNGMRKFSNALRKVGIDLRPLFFKSVLSNFGGELKLIISGGAALNQEVIDFFESIGVVILNGYGITECAPLISANRNEYRKQGSVGLPILGGHVKIADPDENGEGEICYKGPNVMLGYYKNEEATREAFDGEGYFRTGDYGKIELEGNDQWLYITGRKKNLIIFSNGKNVYPEEIEADIQGVYGVGEVVVYAGESKSDPQKEVIVAEIYPDADALKLRGITDAQTYFDGEIKKINQKNVSYKTVGKVKIRTEEFPKTTSRKIIRFRIDKSID
ncbi:MAG: AMP-binding protein [Clostridia bacterium]|nr:AMP-binding protein [Clostridia bacterium]